MGLLIASPEAGMDLRAAGLNGNGSFIVTSRDGHAVRIPEDQKVALAAHLLWGSPILNQETLKALRVACSKKRMTVEHQKTLTVFADVLENLIVEMLDNDPRTSTKPEYGYGKGEG